MELKEDDTFSINKGGEIIKGNYKIKAGSIIFMINNRTIEGYFSVEFLMGPDDIYWTRMN